MSEDGDAGDDIYINHSELELHWRRLQPTERINLKVSNQWLRGCLGRWTQDRCQSLPLCLPMYEIDGSPRHPLDDCYQPLTNPVSTLRSLALSKDGTEPKSLTRYGFRGLTWETCVDIVGWGSGFRDQHWLWVQQGSCFNTSPPQTSSFGDDTMRTLSLS
jgi:hypothetical protein